MSYFSYFEASRCYPAEWEQAFNYLLNQWPPEYRQRLPDLERHIEVKALYVFTLSRHLIERAESLAVPNGWKPVFIEAMMLLFPMIELVGQARLGSRSGSDFDFGSGLDWLSVPDDPPKGSRGTNQLKDEETRLSSLGKYMTTLREGPRIREIFHIRNYFVHGLKNQRDKDFDIGAVKTSMNFELPIAITKQSRHALLIYWRQLTNPDVSQSQDWVSRIAKADIYPFGIMGSCTYEEVLVDPGIVDDWILRL